MGLKKELRKVLRDKDDELGLEIHPDDINAVVNAIHKRVMRDEIQRAKMAGAYRAGFLAAAGLAAYHGATIRLTHNPYQEA